MDVTIEKMEKTATASGENNSVKVTGTVVMDDATGELKSASVQFYNPTDGSHIGYCSMTQDSFSMNVRPVTKNVECSMAFNEFLAGVQAQL